VIVGCKEKHKVRLDPRRFWAAARCPKCKTPVDPTRIRRVLALIAIIYRMSATGTAVRRTIWLSWGYLAAVTLLALGFWIWADAWWPMTVLLFGPRWLVLLPLVGLIPAAVKYSRRSLVPLGLALLIVAGPTMGFRTGWRSWFTGGDSVRSIRVVTYNVAGGRALRLSASWIMEELRADIVAFQECGRRMAESIANLSEVAVAHHIEGSLCLVSRFPIVAADQMERENLEFAGGSGLVIRYTIEAPGQNIRLTNVHLDTPRAGLERLRAGDVSGGQRRLLTKTALREIESRLARRWADSVSGPFLVVGDFNTPVESVIYRRDWGDLRNAFSHAGFGFGATRLNGWIRVRIDHILASDGWQVQRAFVGPNFGSDHRPVVADLIPPEEVRTAALSAR
jgi:endonuclease/exonuclease/phosphatase (EEP) superfamily protein YafD